MGQEILNNEMMKLYEELVQSLEQTKKIKQEKISSDLLFVIYSLSQNKMSEIFSKSAIWINSEAADQLLEQGYVQRINQGDQEKYTLTFKGIVQSIKMKYNKTIEEQFLDFLEWSDKKFNTVEQTKLSWKEKLGSLSLILMASTSSSSAIRLNNEADKVVLGEVFEKILACLKKFSIVPNEAIIKTVSRGESPASGLMSRLNDLTRKTNHYYQNLKTESGYFFDIEKEGNIDQRRLLFLFRKIFEQCNPDYDYTEMYRELTDISNHYLTKFLSRSTNSTAAFSILRGLKDFMEKEIWRSPLQSSTRLRPSKEKNE